MNDKLSLMILSSPNTLPCKGIYGYYVQNYLFSFTTLMYLIYKVDFVPGAILLGLFTFGVTEFPKILVMEIEKVVHITFKFLKKDTESG